MENNQPTDNIPIADLASQGPVQAGQQSSSAGLYSSDMNKYYLDSSLEVRQQGAVVSGTDTTGYTRVSSGGFKGLSRHKAIAVSAVITLIVTALTGASLLIFARKAPDSNKQSQIETQDVSLTDASTGGIPSELQGAEKSLLVNGDIITRGTIKVANNSFVTIIKTSDLTANHEFVLPDSSGTLCLDSNNCNNASLDQFNTLSSQLGQLQDFVDGIEIAPSTGGPAVGAGVSSLNGQSGSVSIQGSLNQITVNTAGGVLTLSTPQNLDANANVQFGSIRSNSFQQTGAGNNVVISASNDTLTFVSGGRTFTLPTVGGANQEICTNAVTCAAGGGQALILGPGAAQVENTAASTIFVNDTGGGHLIQLQRNGVDELVVANNGDTTINGNLTVSSLGAGIVKSSSGGLLSVGSVSLASEVSGTLPVTNGGTGVTSLTQYGVLLGAGSGNVGTASPGALGQCLTSNGPGANPSFQSCPGSGGVSSVNALNGSVTLQGTANQVTVSTGAGTITFATPQNIHTLATPSFAGLTIGSLNGILRATTGVVSVGNVNLTNEVTGVLPLANGGTGTSTTPINGQLLIGNSATNNYSLAGLTAGAGINIVNGNGSITISSPSGGTCATCANAALSNLSSVAINTDLLPGTVGIGLGSAAVAFDDLYLDVAAGAGSLRLIASPSTPGNYTVTFPNASGTVCLTTGNCAGVGNSVGGTGTNNRLAKFTTTGSQIGDSNISDNGTTVSVTGAFSVSTTATISGALTASSFNALGLQANATGFQLSGGTSSRTLIVSGNTALNQNLRTSDSPSFAGLTLSAPLAVGSGGTGVSGTPTNGQLLIGNGTGFSLAGLTAGSGITITNGAGSILIESPAAGTCTVSCADRSLSNLASVNINTSLLPDATQTVHLGSTTRPFQSLHINSVAGVQGFLLTGSNVTGSEVTLTLPSLNGMLALVQTGGSSVAQTGDLNVTGNLIGGRIISTLLGSSDNGVSGAVTFRSGNAAAGNSGSVTIDVGTATGTAGTIGIGGTSATAITVGRSGLAVQFPGGINTQGANIDSANGSLDLGSGDITFSGTINSNILGASYSVLYGTLDVQGGLLSVGDNNSSGTLALGIGDGNFVHIRTHANSDQFDITLPESLPGGLECVTLSNTGQLATQNCTGGIAGNGPTNDGYVPIFTTGGTQLTDSIIHQIGSDIINIQNEDSRLIIDGGTVGGVGFSSLSLGNGSSRTGGIDFYNEFNSNFVTIQSGETTSGYTLKLPTELDTSGKCLSVGALGQIEYFPCISGGGGGGAGVTGTGTTNTLARWTNGGLSVIGNSIIQDNGSRVGIGVAPHVSDVLSVGSGAAFRVTNAGALTVNGIGNNNAGISSVGSLAGVTTLSVSDLITSTANNQALTLSGTPTNNAAQSLVQIGGAISGGNNSANGGTYIGLNAPNSGAGSTADLVNLQKNNSSLFRIATTGAVTGGAYNGLSLQSNATGFQIAGGNPNSRTLTVTANATINQNLSTTSDVNFNSLDLAAALGVTDGGTGLSAGPNADGQILIGASNGTYSLATISAGAGINISNGAGTIQISAPGSGTCVNCADRQLSNLTGTTAIPVHLLPNAAGTINLGSAQVPYRNLYLAGTSNTPGTNNFTITGIATAPRTITLPDADGTICVAGSCAGLGGGITGTGSNNTIAKFNGTSGLTNSTLSDDGTTVTASNDLTVTNDLTAGTVNALGLQANLNGFAISGGTSSKTLTILENVSLDQSLMTTDGVTFDSLNLANALGEEYGGTGVDGSTAANGQLLIGNGSGFTLNTLTSDGTVVITNGAGTIQLSAPGLGTCSTCANQALSNLSNVNINTSLLAGSSTIDLGSTAQPFRDLYVGGSATNNFRFTGTASGGQKTITLDNLTGRMALVQTAGGSTTQTGDINVSNSLISGVDVQTTYVTINNTSASSTALISASNNNLSYTGNLIDLRYGNPSPSSQFTVSRTGAVTIAGNVTANGAGPNTFANSLQVTTGTIQAPTVNAVTAITLGSVNINTAGTLNNVAYLNQANTFSASNNDFTGTGTALSVTNNASINGTATIGTLSVTNNATITGGTLTIGNGTGPLGQGTIVLYDGGSGVNAHTATVQVNSGLAQNTTYTIPNTGFNTADFCLVYNTNQTNCTGLAGGVGVSGTPNANRVAKFTNANTIAESIIIDDGSNILLDNSTSTRTFGIASLGSGTGRTLIVQGGGTAGTTGGNLQLQAGSGASSPGSVIVRANGANRDSTFVIEQTGGADLFIADTSAMRIKIGDASPNLAATNNGDLFVEGTVEILGRLLVGTTSNGLSFNAGGTQYQQFRLIGDARNAKTITLSPEFAGAVLAADGDTSTTGYMTAGSAGSGTAWRNYYQWESAESSAQYYTIIVRATLPEDFSAWQTGSCPAADCALEIDYQTGLSGATNNSVGVRVSHTTETPGTATCTLSEAGNTAWTSYGCTSTILTDGTGGAWDTAGETAVIRIRVKANSTASALARVGDIKLRYLSRF